MGVLIAFPRAYRSRTTLPRLDERSHVTDALSYTRGSEKLCDYPRIFEAGYPLHSRSYLEWAALHRKATEEIEKLTALMSDLQDEST